MAKLTRPILLSNHFKIKSSKLNKYGVFNISLNVDTPLYIDPVLLIESKHKEMNECATNEFNKHFEKIIILLKASQEIGDYPWKRAKKLLDYPEKSATCLGTGELSTSGTGLSGRLRDEMLRLAKQIIDLGDDNPDLFMLLPLLQEGIGFDRISDMATNIIYPCLVAFTARIAKQIKIDCEEFVENGKKVLLPRNPFSRRRQPIILVPKDVLRDIPIPKSWSEIAEVAHENEKLRDRVSELIGTIWTIKSKKDRELFRKRVLANIEAYEVFKETLFTVDKLPYYSRKDKNSVQLWDFVAECTQDNPLELKLQQKITKENVYNLVLKIIEKFKFLIEDRRLSSLLWYKNKSVRESVAQKLFFAVADSYCEANNLDISPEVDSGGGPVDFKFSSGYNIRILVEVKLSKNTKLVDGYTKQLEAYKKAEKTTEAVYLVIDVGKMGKKQEKLTEVRNEYSQKGYPLSEIIFIDGNQRQSGSKL